MNGAAVNQKLKIIDANFLMASTVILAKYEHDGDALI